MSVKAVLDALIPALEPRSSARDETHARFVELSAEPEMLYGWPRQTRLQPEGTGELDRERFVIRLAWAVDATDEIAGGERSRATSDKLYDRVDAIGDWVRHHRRLDDEEGLPVWEHLELTAVDYDSLISNTVRGVYVDLDGYTLRS